MNKIKFNINKFLLNLHISTNFNKKKIFLLKLPVYILLIISIYIFSKNNNHLFLLIPIFAYFVYFYTKLILINNYKKYRYPFIKFRKFYNSKSNFSEKIKLKIAEIGVREGNNAQNILEILQTKKLEIEELVLIDPYKEYYDFVTKKIVLPQSEEDRNFENLRKKFKSFKNVKIVRKASEDAVNDFRDEYFNLIYIDGNHDYKYIKNDLNLWYKKLKKGGMIAGDDYSHRTGEGVMKACQEFCFDNKIIIHLSDDNQFWFWKL